MTLRVMMHDPMHERSLAVSLFVLLFPCKIEKCIHDHFRKDMFIRCDCDCDFLITTNGLHRIQSKCPYGAIATTSPTPTQPIKKSQSYPVDRPLLTQQWGVQYRRFSIFIILQNECLSHSPDFLSVRITFRLVKVVGHCYHVSTEILELRYSAQLLQIREPSWRKRSAYLQHVMFSVTACLSPLTQC